MQSLMQTPASRIGRRWAPCDAGHNPDVKAGHRRQPVAYYWFLRHAARLPWQPGRMRHACLVDETVCTGTGKLHCTSTSRTDVGKVRQHNEDACLDRPDVGLWVVADGMGGHSAGDVASGMIVSRLATLEPAASLSRFLDQVESTLETVNRDLRKLAASREAATIGSTVAALLSRGGHAICAWAGDSRIYRLRDGELEQITQDHALVADLVDRGVLTAAQAANHPQSNLVTRAVGAGDALKLDCEIVTLRPGDRFILCSDGLDKEVDDSEVRDAASRASDEDLADTLVELALSRGSRDNVTVIVVDVHGDGRGSGDVPVQPSDSEDTVPGFTTGRGPGSPGAGGDATARGDATVPRNAAPRTPVTLTNDSTVRGAAAVRGDATRPGFAVSASGAEMPDDATVPRRAGAPREAAVADRATPAASGEDPGAGGIAQRGGAHGTGAGATAAGGPAKAR